MARHPRSNPRSPVQEGGSNGLLPSLVLAALLAVLFWGWQQDWTSDSSNEKTPAEAPAGRTATTPPAVPALPSSEAISSRARANLAAYFTDDDYPMAAIRKGEQGSVAFVLSVSPEGRVTACRIAQSSGSAPLDQATCRILRSRARFQPARDALGRQVADSATGRIRWVLPAG